MLYPTKTHIQGQRRSPKKMVERVKSNLESNPISYRHSEGSNKALGAPGPIDPTRDWSRPAFEFWVSPVEAQVSSGLLQGQGLWVQQTWEAPSVSPTKEPSRRRPTNWRAIIPKKRSHCAKVLGPTADFPTWRSGKGIENVQGIWLWRPIGFDYRTSTGLGKQTL